MATIKDGKGTLALAAFDTNAELKKHELGRPAPGPNDVSIDVKYCGMCHSDLHATNGDWGMNCFPVAPGHEIAGLVKAVGSDVTEYKIGDRVCVGCFVDSCGTCEQCLAGEQNYCSGQVQTYCTPYPEGKGHDDCAGHFTNGGYTSEITVKKDFVYPVPENITLEEVGPLLCAGITTFSPLNRHVLQKGGNKTVGVVGLGGLGHMAVKIAKAMGCKVTVFSRSDSKKEQAAALGADILVHTDEEALKNAALTFDVILDTVPTQHEISGMLPTLKAGGSFVMIGGVAAPMSISSFQLIVKNYKIEGTLVGGIPETAQMLEFCSKNDIKPEISVIHAKDASAHFKAMHEGSSPAARAVIDMSTLAEL